LTFPFEAVFKHVAHVFLAKGLPKDGDLRPMGFVVYVMEGENFKLIPMPDIAPYFASDAGKSHLGGLFRTTLEELEGAKKQFGVESLGIVMLSEAYTVRKPHNLGREPTAEDVAELRARMPSSLADHPDRKEVLVVNMMTIDKTVVGQLDITQDRKVIYKPLDHDFHPAQGSRFSHLPPEKDAP
jgi:hypothetical protein